MSEQLAMELKPSGEVRPSPSWPLERVEKLKQLCDEGWSCSQMGAALSVSRNSIIGKLARMGLHSKITPSTRGPNWKQRTPRPKADLYGRTRKPYERKPPMDFDNYQSPEAEVVPLKLSLFELTETTCRYPYGEPGDKGFFFCGLTIAGETSYCAAHYHICHHNRPWGNERPDVKYRFLKRVTKTQGMSRYSVIPPEAA